MTAPFTTQRLRRTRLLDRVFRRNSQANLLNEITNLLASAPRVSAVSEKDLSLVAETYKVDPTLRCATQLQELYGAYLQHCLSDGTVSDEEVEELAHLKRLFGLSDIVVDQIHDRVAERVYGENVAAAMMDGRLTPEETAFLGRLRTELRLSDEIANQITSREAQQRLGAHLNEAVADQRLSVDEEKELYAIARSFGTMLETDEKTQNALHHFRLYWLIENGHLPQAVDPGIYLERGEICHAIHDVEWYEMRAGTRGVNPEPRSARIRIAKGLSYRAGWETTQRMSEDAMTLTDSGRVFLTNRRLIFKGARKRARISLKKILSFTPFSNGVEIQTKSGRNPFLKLGTKADLFALTLERIVRENA